MRLTESIKAGQVRIWDWDITSDTLVWNEQMFKIYGVPKIDGYSTVDLWKKALHPKDAEFAIEALEDTVIGINDYSLVFRIIRPNGEVRHI